MKIAVGMSGGVDSSVAVYLMKQAGYDVVGTIMKIGDKNRSSHLKGNTCYSMNEEENIEEALGLCRYLDIPLHIIDCSEQYRDIVLGYFSREYKAGRTPNPCIMCNRNVKFDILPSLLAKSGVVFDKFATGHYARVEYNRSSGRYLLKRARDSRKDQTYFLYRLSQEQLAKAMFPIGEYYKSDVRKIASDAGLPVRNKKESQDFYSGDYTELIATEGTEGNIIDTDGKIIGKHRGVCNFTIGQRKRIGVYHKKPLYVISINAEKNEIVVDKKKHLLSNGLIASDVNIIVRDFPNKASAKIRSSSKEVECSVSYFNNELEVIFNKPQYAVTPGQSVVLYDEDIVLGGGIIKKGFPGK